MELAQRNIYRDARWDTLPTEWLLAAAKQGNEKAQIRIVEMVLAEKCPTENEEGVLPFLLTAAQNGNKRAQIYLGTKLAEGKNISLSQETAIAYLLAAANQGDKKAQSRIVSLAQSGVYKGATWVDLPKTWLIAAARQGNTSAQVRLVESGSAYVDSEWIVVAAQHGNEKAQAQIVKQAQEADGKSDPENRHYYYIVIPGLGKVTDYEWKTFPKEWLIAAARQGNKKAQVHIGAKLAEGESFDLPKETARAYLNAAAEQGDPAAKRALRSKFRGKLWL